MVSAISSAIEKRAFLNNSKSIGSWMAVMALSPYTAGASRWHHLLLMALILQYLGKKVPLAYLAPAIAMVPGVALYAGFFSCYNRLMAESGFPKAAQAIRAV